MVRDEIENSGFGRGVAVLVEIGWDVGDGRVVGISKVGLGKVVSVGAVVHPDKQEKIRKKNGIKQWFLTCL
jgi:hypothetical protein